MTSDVIETRVRSWTTRVRGWKFYIQMGARWAKRQRRKIRMARKRRRGWA